MGRNIVICFDGTNNKFGVVNTNVVRLVQVLEREQLKQRLYYDPGVGTLPEPWHVLWISKKLSDLCGLAFGSGLMGKVQAAYSYLMDIWEPDDQIYIFGFSRGAYTARVLAGLLHTLGLLPRGNNNLVPYLMLLYKGIRDERSARCGDTGPWQQLCDSFRWTFARGIPDVKDRRCPVHFLGVWDTVSSVGWIWDPLKLPYTAKNPSIKSVRHAVSIDERRWFFRENLFKQALDQDVKEYWFPGVHCDVGGGYADTHLWQSPFEWMLAEARVCGLLVNEERLTEVLPSPPCEHPWKEKEQKSLTGIWWLAELVPKRVWKHELQTLAWRLGMGGHRKISIGALMDKTTLLKIRETDYRPKNISPKFFKKVKELSNVPESLPYDIFE